MTKPGLYRCSVCGHEFRGLRRRCPHCGTVGVDTRQRSCRDCGVPLVDSEVQRCPACGSIDVELIRPERPSSS